jgi:glycosyltransferase involved in cell wall biosynthesis
VKKLVSYIFPIYDESGNIDLLYKTMQKLLASKDEYSFELIFVNDGSKDDSLHKLVNIQKKDNRVKVVDLSRNYGHQIAVTAGLDLAKGDAIIIMDSDMQDPPKVSFALLAKWEEGFDVVYAQRKTRKDTIFKKFTANMFYRTLQKLASIDIPRNTGDFRLIDRKVLKSVNSMREHDRFLRGMVAWVGFKQIGVEFDRDARNAGTTNYPLKKMVKLAGDGILGFSTYPLQIIAKLGYFISVLAFLGIVYAMAYKLFYPEKTVEGWTFIVISILLMGGIQLITLGILGSYIGRIYTEVQARPLYLVQKIYESK